MSEAVPPLLGHPLVRQLLALRLAPADFAVFGSGPLLALGIRDAVSDLDIVARGAAWTKAVTYGQPVTAPSGHGRMVELAGGSLQIFDAWTSPDWNVDELIDNADLVAGIRFVAVADVVRWKRSAHRPKDVADLRLIERAGAGPQR